MSAKLETARANVAEHMDSILRIFKPGAKITVMVRRPGQPEQDFLMTDDDLAEAVKLIGRRQAAGAAS